MKRRLLIILLFMNAGNVFAANDLSFLPHTHYKYKTIHWIFTDIVSAFGREKDDIQIEMNTFETSKRVAYYDVNKQLIVFDEKLYNICTGLGKDSLSAMAMIIGHELAHHYNNLPGQESILYWQTGEIKNIDDKANKISRISIETRADFIGGYYAYIAGYKSYNIAPELYEAIYNSYPIQPSDKYPSKEGRKTYAQIAMNDLKKDIAVFEAGELLMLSGRYVEAAASYKFLYPIFPSREIANNVATALLLDEISKNSKSIKYKIPLEFDPYTRMYGVKDQNEYQARDIDTKNIHEAIKYLKIAINIDSAYTPAYINICSAFYLLGNIDSAKYYLQNIPISDNCDTLKTQSSIQTFKALFAENEGKHQVAKAYFIQAVKTFNLPTNIYNLYVFDGSKTQNKPLDVLKIKDKTTDKDIIDEQFKGIKGFNSVQVSENPFILLKFKIVGKANYITVAADDFNMSAIVNSGFLDVKDYNKLLSDKSFLYEYKTATGFYRVFNNKLLYFNKRNYFAKDILFYSFLL